MKQGSFAKHFGKLPPTLTSRGAFWIQISVHIDLLVHFRVTLLQGHFIKEGSFTKRGSFVKMPPKVTSRRMPQALHRHIGTFRGKFCKTAQIHETGQFHETSPSPKLTFRAISDLCVLTY